MKKTTITALVILGLGTAAFAYGPGGGHCKKGPFGAEHRGGIHKLVKQLDLTADQKKEFEVLKESRKKMMISKREEHKGKRSKMMQKMRPDMSHFMSADNFDKDAFKKELSTKFEKRDEMRKKRQVAMLEKRADGMQKHFNILTPEQRIKLIELSKENR